jgi:hypothetical protein
MILSVSRRGFLRTSTLAVAFGSVSLELAMVARANNISGEELAVSFEPHGPGPLRFSPSTFSPHLNSNFRVHLNNSSSVDLKLAEVSEDTPSPKSKKYASKSKSFSLEFTASGSTTFPSGNYLMEHAALGKFLLFISPVSRSNKRPRYQAIFNHLLAD